MFILNKTTKTIQECHNQDAIKACKKDADHYAVAETREELLAPAKEPEKAPEENTGKPSQEPQNKPEEGKGGETPKEEQKNAPEGTQGAQGGTSEGGQQDGTNEDPLNTAGDERLAELNAKKVAELREIAKAAGIQGYANMNKDTLIAMIMNH